MKAIFLITPKQLRLSLTSLCMFCLMTITIFAQSKEKLTVFDNFLNEESATYFELVFDFELLDSLKKLDEEQDAKLTLNEQSWNIDLKARGKYRRRICDFPPIKLEFKKDELDSAGFKKHNDYKLVTHCIEGPEGKEHIYREYLAYKLLELLSPDLHFRTQLVKVKYIDSGSKKKFTRFGIIIEDEKTVAKRLDSDVCDGCFSLPIDSFYNENLHNIALFQYMIGNTDWSVTLSRNVKILNCDNTEKYYIVPYDFDFSGLVNASYAIPNSDFQLKSVRDRVYLGLETSPEKLEETVKHYKDMKDELLTYIKKFKLLSSESRKDIKDYLESFYEMLDDGSFDSHLATRAE